jgi:hypothetical protein
MHRHDKQDRIEVRAHQHLGILSLNQFQFLLTVPLLIPLLHFQQKDAIWDILEGHEKGRLLL